MIGGKGRNRMVRGFVGSTCALVTLLVLAAGAASAQEVVSGTVKQIDERTGVIVLDDGRQVQTTSRSVVLVERPVDRLAAIQPGSNVVVIQRAAPSASPRLAPDAAAVSPYGPSSQEAP
jgi:hypothetical protein